MSKIQEFAGGDSPAVAAAWMVMGAAGALALALLLPMDVLAAAGTASSGDGTTTTKNFNKNGKGALKDVGVPLFGFTAMAGIVMGAFAKKFAIAAGVVLISAAGLAITQDPESTMKSLGDGITGMFSS